MAETKLKNHMSHESHDKTPHETANPTQSQRESLSLCKIELIVNLHISLIYHIVMLQKTLLVKIISLKKVFFCKMKLVSLVYFFESDFQTLRTAIEDWFL